MMEMMAPKAVARQTPERQLTVMLTAQTSKWSLWAWYIAGYKAGAGAHLLILADPSKGGCGVNQVGGTHEVLHILGLAHTQNRADRCNYIDVNTDLMTGWGEWGIQGITGIADWFELRWSSCGTFESKKIPNISKNPLWLFLLYPLLSATGSNPNERG